MDRNSTYKYYEKELKRMLSNDDFKLYLGGNVKNNIMKYSELKNYKDINELLPNDQDYKIILIETKKNSGHWCCIERNNNIIYWFDSYGLKFDEELKYVSTIMKKLLGEEEHQMERLMRTCKSLGLKCDYNKHNFQSDNENVSTCGRWCVIALQMLKLKYTFDEIFEFFERNSFNKKKPFDVLAVDFTSVKGLKPLEN